MYTSKSFFRFVGALAGTAFLIGVCFYLFVFRLFSAVSASSDALSFASSKIILAETSVQRGSENQKMLDSIKPMLDRIDSMFLHSDAPLPFIKSIEDIGRSAHVDLSVDLLEGSPGALPSFRLTAIGSIADTLTFLRMIENAPVLITVNAMTLDRLGAEESALAKQKRNITSSEARMVLVISGLGN